MPTALKIALAFCLTIGQLAVIAMAEQAIPTREIAGLTGPAKPKGFSVKTLASIDLGDEYPEVEGAEKLRFRARFVTLQPGGIVLIHSHKGRPATTYIVSGEAVEYRSDTDGPIVRRAGDATMDVEGIAQWWENTTDEVVTMFVSDVISPNSPKEQ